MELNWNPEVIIDFIVGTIILITSALTYFEPKTKRLRSLLFIRLGIFLMAIFFYFDGLSILFLNEILSRINAIIMFVAITFLVIGINYIVTESIKSTIVLVSFCIGAVMFYLVFQPETVGIVFDFGYLNVNWLGLLEIMGSLMQLIAGGVLFYWGFKTWINAPFLIKREALIFFIGVFISGPCSIFIYVFYYWDPIFIIYTDLMMGLGCLIFMIAIMKEPKLLYILPFTVYRILVKDRKGHPLFDHDWTELHIDENIFTGFLNAVQLMSEEVMNIGGLLDINLEEGILILNESKSITVGLVSSKSSKLLRESVVRFTNDFETKFDKELKKSEKDMSQYNGAFELIEKYFTNFPYKIIKSKKHPLLLTGKFAKIPLELENKLRKIFPDEKEFETIKAELIKSPLSLSSDFLNLYGDLKDELKQISEEDIKFLDEKFEETESDHD